MRYLEQTQSSLVPINNLASDPYMGIICYPSPTKKRFQSRLRELMRLSIVSIDFVGEVRLGSLRVLGKGTSGIVVKAHRLNGSVALKIRRVDSVRKSSRNEANVLRLANRLGIGPKVLGVTKNFLVMDLLDGKEITYWVRNLKGKGSTKQLRINLRDLLEQCFTLDIGKIDHGELSNLRKHVIIGKNVSIIDFESSGIERRTSNVTSAVQYLFIGGPISKKVRRMLRVENTEDLILALRAYKSKMDETSFGKILSRLNLKS